MVNIKNEDNQCFLWSILAALHPVECNNNRCKKYEKFLPELNTKGIEMPMKLDDITKFERLNNLCINVYGIEEHGSAVFPLRISPTPTEKPINLLLIIGKEHDHFTLVPDLNKLLGNGKKHAKEFCPFCLHGFDKRHGSVDKFSQHKQECRENAAARVEFPPRGKRTIKFNMYAKQLAAPLIAVCDFEAINEKVKDSTANTSNTTCLTEHNISGFCIQLIGAYKGIGPFEPIYYSGPDAALTFLKEMRQINIMMEELYNMGGKEVMKELTPEEKKEYAEASTCHICSGEITCNLTHKQWQAEKLLKNEEEQEGETDEGDADECMETNDNIDDFWKGPKVRDHCHWEGDFRGAAHADCNWRYHATKKLPVIFHNLSGTHNISFKQNYTLCSRV